MSKRSRRTTSTRRVVGYVRVSTDKQADTGHSIEAQRAKLDAYCALYGYDLVTVEADEGASGKTRDGRPGLEGALELCRTGAADAVLVVKLDRLTRSTRDLGALLEEAQTEPKRRAKTRLNRVGKTERLKVKKVRGTVKANRGRPSSSDW
jgi:predicted site-specific integrase-resolvase